MMFMKKNIWALLPLALILSQLQGCGESSNITRLPEVVELYQVGSVVQEPTRVIHGRVVPADLTRVSFRLAGKIKSLKVHTGDLVRQGQVLAELDSAIQKQTLSDAEARYQLSFRQLKRAESLSGTASITPAQKDELRAALKLAKANLQLARNALSYTRIVAPFTGIVAEVHKESFESVASGEPVLNIYRNDRIDVLMNLPDDIPARSKPSKSHRKMGFDVTFVGHDQPYEMHYLKSSMARSPDTQAFQFWMTMPALNPDSKNSRFPPGLPVTIDVDMAQVNIATDQGVIVPSTALQAQTGDSQQSSFRVWRYVDGVVEPVPVTVRHVTQKGTLIDSGLSSGDQIVKSGWEKLNPGQAVDVSNALAQTETDNVPVEPVTTQEQER
jgi:RND family efflux transporter MFP subunit